MLKQLKKIWLVLTFYKIWLLVIIFILITSLGFLIVRNYLFKKDLAELPPAIIGPEIEDPARPLALSPEELEQQLHLQFDQRIKGQITQCVKNFDLNKLDFNQPIWHTELLSVMLPLLIAMEAFQQNKETECDYFKNKGKVNPELTVENCLRRYRFLKTTVELEKGMDCQSYLGECKKFSNLDVEEKEREEAERIICETLCQSYRNKTPIILAPKDICDNQPSPLADAVDYLEAGTNQSKTCWSGIADEIKFLIAVAGNDANGCLAINDPKTSVLCRFYFDRNYLKVYKDEFKENYCKNLIEKVVIPSE